MDKPDRIQQIREVHPWASEEEIRFVLMSRYWHFTRELDLEPNIVSQALENCVLIYRRLPKQSMMEIIHRMKIKFYNQTK